MSQLKSLASQTALYGVSSILGRLINYALVPLHTSVFVPEQLGVVTALYAYTAIFMIAYTYGMETAFFRYVKEAPEKTYQAATITVIFISTVLTIGIYLFSDELANEIGYQEAGSFVRWISIIMWIDAFLAIPFAKLRFQNKAKKFALIKIVNILLNIVIQFSLLQLLPLLFEAFDISIGHIFLANLIANGSILLFFFNEIKQLRFHLEIRIVKSMLVYSTPIFFMGLAGMLNEQLDKILIEHILPDTYYENMNSAAALGVYGQTFKLGIFMMLAVQAFRYAGEPFFFSKAEDKNAPELFARVMHYFIISSLLLFVLVSINVDLIAYIFLRKPEFRVALYLVPLLLFGKLLYGIYLNLSIWFKLKNKTQYGLYFSLVGVVITVVGNIILIPTLGLLGCTIVIMCSYAVMCILCYIYGRKYFPIPYNFMATLPYFIISLLIVITCYYVKHPITLADIIIKVAISGVLVYALWLIEKNKLTTKTS
ncbi:MAG: oligosaccharide flippase family protein [Bacteroidota bacterium]